MPTFNVDNVTIKSPSLRKGLDADHYKQELACIGIKSGTVEAKKFSTTNPVELIASRQNAFVHTLAKAYDEHVPLILSPDDLWLVILQAVANHIRLNAEDCRKALVNFEGKEKLVIYIDSFIKGSPDNDWESAFAGFGDQIEKYLGKKRDMFDPTFTTTTLTTKAAMQVQMMSALSAYFDYEGRTRCGIPNITLLGEPTDWAKITNRVQTMGEFYPAWALTPLIEAMDEFENASKGSVNRSFWQNLVKVDGMSGGPYLSGWINAFFPYVGDKPNSMMQSRRGTFRQALEAGDHGPQLGSIPGSVVGVPMNWVYYNKNIPMQLASGIFGTTTEAAGYRCATGWVVGEAKEG